MTKLEQFIDNNFSDFSGLEDSEVCELALDDADLDSDMIDYLKAKYRFDYKGICVYYNANANEIWVENMLAED
jgi:hypothetical protein